MEVNSSARIQSMNQSLIENNKYREPGNASVLSSSMYPADNVQKKDPNATRPCAVIGPENVIPPYKVDAYVSHAWPQSSEATAYYHPQVQYASERPLYPPRNISPRHTFQENMSRIIVPSPSEANISQHRDSIVLPQNAKASSAMDNKAYDGPVVMNHLVDLVRPQYRRSGEAQARHPVQPQVSLPSQYALHPSTAKLHNSYPNVYSYNNEYNVQRYSLDYQNQHRIQIVKNNQVYHKVPEQSYLVPSEYPGNTYTRVNNVRYEPYPAKDKYVQPRYDYSYQPAGQYSEYPAIHKYTEPKKRNIPTDTRYYLPQKYVESYSNHMVHNSDFRTKIPVRRQNVTYYTEIPGPPVDPYTGQNKVYGINLYDKNNQHISYSRAAPEPTKVKVDYWSHYRPVPYTDVRIAHENTPSAHYNRSNVTYSMKPPEVNTYAAISNPTYPKQPLEPQFSERDVDHEFTNQKYYYNQRFASYNPLARIPTEFSPNVISPSDSNTSYDSANTNSQQYQEDGGYVSQCSTVSTKSAHDFQPEFTKLIPEHSYQNTFTREKCHLPVSNLNPVMDKKNKLDKKATMDLRQYIEMWDEELEDTKMCKQAEERSAIDNHHTFHPPQVAAEFPPAAPTAEQLYVLDKMSIPVDDLHKYDHIQKVTQLPDNIKDFPNLEGSKKAIDFSAKIENHTQNIKTNKFNGVNQTYLKPRVSYDNTSNEFIDVEAKISQSIIHKDVGCNFEIKPCSPGKPMELKVEIAPGYSAYNADLKANLDQSSNHKANSVQSFAGAPSNTTSNLNYLKPPKNVAQPRDDVTSKCGSNRLSESSASENMKQNAAENLSKADVNLYYRNYNSFTRGQPNYQPRGASSDHLSNVSVGHEISIGKGITLKSKINVCNSSVKESFYTDVRDFAAKSQNSSSNPDQTKSCISVNVPPNNSVTKPPEIGQNGTVIQYKNECDQRNKLTLEKSKVDKCWDLTSVNNSKLTSPSTHVPCANSSQPPNVSFVGNNSLKSMVSDTEVHNVVKKKQLDFPAEVASNKISQESSLPQNLAKYPKTPNLIESIHQKDGIASCNSTRAKHETVLKYVSATKIKPNFQSSDKDVNQKCFDVNSIDIESEINFSVIGSGKVVPRVLHNNDSIHILSKCIDGSLSNRNIGVENFKENHSDSSCKSNSATVSASPTNSYLSGNSATLSASPTNSYLSGNSATVSASPTNSYLSGNSATMSASPTKSYLSGNNMRNMPPVSNDEVEDLSPKSKVHFTQSDESVVVTNIGFSNENSADPTPIEHRKRNSDKLLKIISSGEMRIDVNDSASNESSQGIPFVDLQNDTSNEKSIISNVSMKDIVNNIESENCERKSLQNFEDRGQLILKPTTDGMSILKENKNCNSTFITSTEVNHGTIKEIKPTSVEQPFSSDSQTIVPDNVIQIVEKEFLLKNQEEIICSPEDIVDVNCPTENKVNSFGSEVVSKKNSKNDKEIVDIRNKILLSYHNDSFTTKEGKPAICDLVATELENKNSALVNQNATFIPEDNTFRISRLSTMESENKKNLSINQKDIFNIKDSTPVICELSAKETGIKSSMMTNHIDSLIAEDSTTAVCELSTTELRNTNFVATNQNDTFIAEDSTTAVSELSTTELRNTNSIAMDQNDAFIAEGNTTVMCELPTTELKNTNSIAIVQNDAFIAECSTTAMHELSTTELRNTNSIAIDQNDIIIAEGSTTAVCELPTTELRNINSVAIDQNDTFIAEGSTTAMSELSTTELRNTNSIAIDQNDTFIAEGSTTVMRELSTTELRNTNYIGIVQNDTIVAEGSATAMCELPTTELRITNSIAIDQNDTIIAEGKITVMREVPTTEFRNTNSIAIDQNDTIVAESSTTAICELPTTELRNINSTAIDQDDTIIAEGSITAMHELSTTELRNTNSIAIVHNDTIVAEGSTTSICELPTTELRNTNSTAIDQDDTIIDEGSITAMHELSTTELRNTNSIATDQNSTFITKISTPATSELCNMVLEDKRAITKESTTCELTTTVFNNKTSSIGLLNAELHAKPSEIDENIGFSPITNQSVGSVSLIEAVNTPQEDESEGNSRENLYSKLTSPGRDDEPCSELKNANKSPALPTAGCLDFGIINSANLLEDERSNKDAVVSLNSDECSNNCNEIEQEHKLNTLASEILRTSSNSLQLITDHANGSRSNDISLKSDRIYTIESNEINGHNSKSDIVLCKINEIKTCNETIDQFNEFSNKSDFRNLNNCMEIESHSSVNNVDKEENKNVTEISGAICKSLETSEVHNFGVKILEDQTHSKLDSIEENIILDPRTPNMSRELCDKDITLVSDHVFTENQEKVEVNEHSLPDTELEIGLNDVLQNNSPVSSTVDNNNEVCALESSDVSTVQEFPEDPLNLTQQEISTSDVNEFETQFHSVELALESNEDFDPANESIIVYEIRSPGALESQISEDNYILEIDSIVNDEVIEQTSDTNEVIEQTSDASYEVPDYTNNPDFGDNDLEEVGCWIEDVACEETVVSEEYLEEEKCEDSLSDLVPPSPGVCSDVAYSPREDCVNFVPYANLEDQNKVGKFFKDTNSNLILSIFEEKNINEDSTENENKSGDPTVKLSNESKKSDTRVQLGEEEDCHVQIEIIRDSSKKRPKVFPKKSANKTGRILRSREINSKREENENAEFIDTNPDSGGNRNSANNSFRSNYKNMENGFFFNNDVDNPHQGKLITKGAKKYIPPVEASSFNYLKCKLPLPKEKLLSLSKNRSKRPHDEANVNQSHVAKNPTTLPIKKMKPNFEDVLKNIEETNLTWCKMKLKKSKLKNSIPKMILKKVDQGSLYTSEKVEPRSPDLTGNKWQPLVNLSRNDTIEEMIKNKQTCVKITQKAFKKFVLLATKNDYRKVKVSFLSPEPDNWRVKDAESKRARYRKSQKSRYNSL